MTPGIISLSAALYYRTDPQYGPSGVIMREAETLKLP